MKHLDTILSDRTSNNNLNSEPEEMEVSHEVVVVDNDTEATSSAPPPHVEFILGDDSDDPELEQRILEALCHDAGTNVDTGFVDYVCNHAASATVSDEHEAPISPVFTPEEMRQILKVSSLPDYAIHNDGTCNDWFN